MKELKRQKSHKMKAAELKAKKEAAAKLAEAERRYVAPKQPVLLQKVRNLPAAIESVFNGGTFPNSERKIQNIIQVRLHHPNQDFLKEIFLHFANLKIEFAEKSSVENDYRQQNSPLKALSNLAKYQKFALRPVKDWEPNSHNLSRQIASFARHLYAKYTIPAFMDEAWYRIPEKWRLWFIHVGKGENIRTANGLDIPLTKKEAHFFMQSPKDFSISQAFRYGQILNIGGNEHFVRQVLKTRIATDYANNDFWMSVFRWFLQNPMLDSAHYAPIVDFIHNQKYVPCRMGAAGQLECAQPNLTMKGRDPESLLNQVEAWHKQLGKEKRGKFTDWVPCGIKELEVHNERTKTLYTIKEICSQKELITEGRSMHHCVGSYAGSCASGRTSIWKFEVTTVSGLEKRLTIEVNNRDRTITQARGKYNAKANASDMHWLNNWARNSGLRVSSWMI